MSLFLLPLLAILLIVFFAIRIRDKRGQQTEQAKQSLEKLQPDKQQNKESQPVNLSTNTQQEHEPEESLATAQQKTVREKAIHEQRLKVVKPAAKKRPKFSPNSPIITQYETELNLQMIQAEKAGDEDAYIEIVRKNAVYMKACISLKKAVEAKDREEIKSQLIKIWKLIPQAYKETEKS